MKKPGSSFEFGDIYWVAPEGWEKCGGFGKPGAKSHPGLVTRPPLRRYQPPEMCPGSTKLREWTGGEIFSPQHPLYRADGWGKLDPSSSFFYLLYLRRPKKNAIQSFFASLHPADHGRLSEILRTAPRKFSDE